MQLKEYRLEKKISQSKLAAQSGIPVKTLQQYEQGNRKLLKASCETVLALSRALEVDIMDLLKEELEEKIDDIKKDKGEIK